MELRSFNAKGFAQSCHFLSIPGCHFGELVGFFVVHVHGGRAEKVILLEFSTEVGELRGLLCVGVLEGRSSPSVLFEVATVGGGSVVVTVGGLVAGGTGAFAVGATASPL
eukprot:14199762-Ditylum_brightwellii.AAC.1